jgi:transcription elongation factor GreA
MIKKFYVSKELYEKVLANMVEIEDGLQKILNEYYPNYTKERDDFTDFIKHYISELDKNIKYLSIIDKAENKFPFVIIGSEVEIEDMDEGDVYKYHIVNPHTRDITNDYISFLSPVGMALLLKKQGEIVNVNTPSGTYRYRIKTIAL